MSMYVSKVIRVHASYQSVVSKATRGTQAEFHTHSSARHDHTPTEQENVYLLLVFVCLHVCGSVRVCLHVCGYACMCVGVCLHVCGSVLACVWVCLHACVGGY